VPSKSKSDGHVVQTAHSLTEMPTVPNATLYRSYADPAAAQAEGEDYRVVVVPRATSRVAVLAPHGGSIEAHTSSIARQIAGADLNLYLFEGMRPQATIRHFT
jgi:phage replication-related protein YjqB (UPF0714/DUF867 family)